MNDRQKIDCASPADRDTLIVILARNGYTVRHGREKRGASKQYTYFVEFWRDREPTPMSKGTKRLTTTVTAQTHYHLYRLAAMAGYSSPGRVIDKLVRDHLNAMRYGDTTNKPNKGGRTWRDSHTGRPRTEKTR